MPDFPETFRPVTQVRKWSATIVANAVSTYALDTVSTVLGVLLVASGSLSGICIHAAAVLLCASYVLWVGGLSSSLTANWRLLETTETSTSILSKLAHDLAGPRIRRTGVRRFLSAAGYVVFELAKETPYYIGAFGLAFASDAVSGEEALVFLAGANAGAAAYEYRLGWSTRMLLQRAGDAPYASFETAWAPAKYLADYYGAVDMDEQNTIAFFSEAAQRMPTDEPALVFGAGPTFHHVFAIATRASEIHLGDYLRCNLDEISRWLRDDEDAHDWQPFVGHTLRCEGMAEPTRRDILDREHLTHARITRLLEVDIRNDRPLADAQRRYATVLSAYCADSATASLDEWQVYMRRIVGLVRPGGHASCCRSRADAQLSCGREGISQHISRRGRHGKSVAGLFSGSGTHDQDRARAGMRRARIFEHHPCCRPLPERNGKQRCLSIEGSHLGSQRSREGTRPWIRL